MEILKIWGHFEDLGDTEWRLAANAVVLVLWEYQINSSGRYLASCKIWKRSVEYLLSFENIWTNIKCWWLYLLIVEKSYSEDNWRPCQNIHKCSESFTCKHIWKLLEKDVLGETITKFIISLHKYECPRVNVMVLIMSQSTPRSIFNNFNRTTMATIYVTIQISPKQLYEIKMTRLKLGR